MTTTPSTASQASAVSIENDWHSRANVLEARLGEVMERRDEWRALAEKAMDDVADHYSRLCKAEARATAAEAKLEAMRQGVEGLAGRPDNWIKRSEVLALLAPSTQPGGTDGLPG